MFLALCLYIFYLTPGYLRFVYSNWDNFFGIFFRVPTRGSGGASFSLGGTLPGAERWEAGDLVLDGEEGGPSY